MNSITVENAILLVKTPPLVKMWLEQKSENANCYWKNHTQCCLLFVALLSLMIIGNKRNDLSSGKTNTRYDLRSQLGIIVAAVFFLMVFDFCLAKGNEKVIRWTTKSVVLHFDDGVIEVVENMRVQLWVENKPPSLNLPQLDGNVYVSRGDQLLKKESCLEKLS